MEAETVQHDWARLARNLDSIRQKIRKACLLAGRDPEAASLVAVTKNVEPVVVAALHKLGVIVCGESRLPQSLAKVEQFGNIAWHFIGRLQSNKVNKAVGQFALIHSVASESLLLAIHRRALALGIVQPVLLQINISGEAAKQGFKPEQLPAALATAAHCSGIRLDGLMTMAPHGVDDVVCAQLFATLDRLAEDAALKHRSMGMSDDFETAVARGATLVRVGSALFEGVHPTAADEHPTRQD